MPEITFPNGLTITVQADAAVQQGNFFLLTGQQIGLQLPFSPGQFYRHGWHSWSLTSWLDAGAAVPLPGPAAQLPQIDHPAYLEAGGLQGAWLGAVTLPDGQALLLGALGLDSTVRLENGRLCGESVRPDCPWVLALGEERQIFDTYAQQLARTFGRRNAAPPPRVWCSWYSVFENISEPLLLGSLQGLADLPFEVFQIDDGWQQDVGDWSPNAKFPSGMAQLAAAVQAGGRTAGLWLAPFLTRPTSALFAQHPDWLLRGGDGQPVSAGHNWGTPLYALDTTLPAVQDWLAETIRRVRAWGYDYLKLDFLYAAALPGKRHAGLPPEQALRQALQLIRQTAGEETYLLLCGVPILPALGIADGLRIGADTGPYFDNTFASGYLHNYAAPGVQNAIRTTLHRLWLRPLCHLDPDAAFFRTQFNLLMPEEKALMRDLCLVAGFKATSDLPFWLSEEEREALRQFWQDAPPVTQSGRYIFSIGEREVDFSPLVPLPCF